MIRNWLAGMSWSDKNNAAASPFGMCVPADWLPKVHREKLYWFWVPNDWRDIPPRSRGCCLALMSDSCFCEVIALFGEKVRASSASELSDLLKRSIGESHRDARILQEESYLPSLFNVGDAGARMKAFQLWDGPSLVQEMKQPDSGHFFAVEYAEQDGQKTTTECYALKREDLLVQINVKTFSSDYRVQKRIIKQVVTSVMLGMHT